MRKSLPIWLAGVAIVGASSYWLFEDGPPQGGAPESGILASAPPASLPGGGEKPPPQADFAGESPSAQARQMADWVLASGDHQGRPFAIVDKVDARVFVFDTDGRLQGAAPALLGLARGDDSVPGIGERPVPEILPHERTTPAGRFVAEPGINTNGEDIVWVDYDAAISMHRLRPVDPRERRLERLASPTPQDNRISYGCINLPPAFYDTVLSPLIGASRGVVYVLPETRPLNEVFASHGFGGGQTWQQAAADGKQEADDAFWQSMMTR